MLSESGICRCLHAKLSTLWREPTVSLVLHERWLPQWFIITRDRGAYLHLSLKTREGSLSTRYERLHAPSRLLPLASMVLEAMFESQ